MHRSINDIVTPPVKTIYVYLNGVENLIPRKVLLNAKKLKNWHRMLEEITKAIGNLYFVKRVFTAKNGIPVNSFLELENSGNYVVSDSRDYIKLENG